MFCWFGFRWFLLLTWSNIWLVQFFLLCFDVLNMFWRVNVVGYLFIWPGDMWLLFSVGFHSWCFFGSVISFFAMKWPPWRCEKNKKKWCNVTSQCFHRRRRNSFSSLRWRLPALSSQLVASNTICELACWCFFDLLECSNTNKKHLEDSWKVCEHRKHKKSNAETCWLRVPMQTDHVSIHQRHPSALRAPTVLELVVELLILVLLLLLELLLVVVLLLMELLLLVLELLLVLVLPLELLLLLVLVVLLVLLLLVALVLVVEDEVLLDELLLVLLELLEELVADVAVAVEELVVWLLAVDVVVVGLAVSSTEDKESFLLLGATSV